MKKLLAPFAIAGLSLSVSAGALAQSADLETGIDAGANATVESEDTNGANADINADTGADVGAGFDANANGNANANAGFDANTDINYGSVISDIRTDAISASDIENIGDDANVEVLTIAELRGQASVDAGTSGLENALDDSSSFESVTAKLEQKDFIVDELNAEGYTVDDVVAVSLASENQVVVVVDATA